MMKEFFSYYKPYRALFILDFGCAVLAALLELTFPFIVNLTIERVLPKEHLGMILLVCLGLLGLYIFNTLMQFIVVYFGHKLGVNIETDMRQELFDYFQRQSFEYYDQKKTGALMSKLTTDLFEISELAHHGPEDIFITIMTVLGSFFLMYRIYPWMAWSTMIVLPFLVIAVIFFNQKMTDVNQDIFQNLGTFNSGIESSISGIRVTQAFANETFEKSRFDALNQGYRKNKLKFYKMMGISSSFNYFMIRLINLFALLSGSFFVIRGHITYGDFVEFILLANIFIRPIEKVNNMIESYPKGIAGFKRFKEELNQPVTIQDHPDAYDLVVDQGSIEYRQVSFEYAESQPVLKDINLTIQPGQTIAFVGPSGAGKTTLCQLLPRFYDVSKGSICIDGQDISEVTLHSLRRHIGIVQQDVFLFPGTIRENILYGNLNASEEELQEAVTRARLNELLEVLPDGLDTYVGDKGVLLSGGQKQRISIARIFLKNPAILILDEATSALDTETERYIQSSFDALSQGRTTLIIAHRLSTIQNADEIIVMKDGEIVETGKHDQLLQKKGYYYNLYQS